MVGASKILTVSYGTFSCTLEGFDDPFSTMKAIAEYFRDLAADDRYFGAEPPQPDAAMLHRIAEREVQRRVEARVQDNGVVLRAGDAPAAPPPAPAVKVEMPGRIVHAPVEIDDAAVTVSPTRPTPGLTAADTALSLSVAEKLRRLRTAAPVAPAVAEAVTDPAPVVERLPQGYGEEADEGPASTISAEPEAGPDAPPTMPEAAEISPVVDMGSDETAPVEAVAPALAPDAEVAADPVGGVEEFPAPETAPQVATAVAAETPVDAEPDLPAPEAAEAVVAVADDIDPVPEPALAAPLAMDDDDSIPAPAEPATDLVAGRDDTIWADMAEDDDALLAALSADFLAVPAEQEPEPSFDVEDDDTAALLATLARELAPAPVATDDIRIDDTPDLSEPTQDAPTAALISALVEPAAPVAADAPGSATDAVQTAPAQANDVATAPATPPYPAAWDATDVGTIAVEPAAAPALATEEMTAAADPDSADSDSPAAPLAAAGLATEAAATAPVANVDEAPASDRLQRARARVIRIRRIEPAAAATASLEPEAEAALERELSDLRGEADPATAPLPETRPMAEVRAAETTLSPRTGLPASAEDDSVRRLLDTANSQMDEPESRRRMSAIAHLKAAVAATVADRRVSGEGGAPQTESRRLDPYRSDLEQVTRPRRPVSSGGAATPRPVEASARPAPLVLVSEQRIDSRGHTAPPVQPARPPAPIRPRRVGSLSVATAPQAVSAMSAQDEDEREDQDVAEDTANIFAGGTGFAEFAQRLGARDLTDLLEAAAVYAACVQGQPSVTRPQLMRAVTDALPDMPDREDMLRSFGRLLRDGRIEKVKRGQFAVPDGARVLQQGRQISG